MSKKKRQDETRQPNAVTVKAMRAADRGEGKRYKSALQLLKDLRIAR